MLRPGKTTPNNINKKQGGGGSVDAGGYAAPTPPKNPYASPASPLRNRRPVAGYGYYSGGAPPLEDHSNSSYDDALMSTSGRSGYGVPDSSPGAYGMASGNVGLYGSPPPPAMVSNRYYGGTGGIPDGDSEGYKEKPRKRKQNWMIHWLGKLKEPWTWPILLNLILITVTMRIKSQQSRFLQEVRASSFQDVIDIIQRYNREKESLRSDLRGMRESYYKANDSSNKFEREKRKLQQELEKLKAEGPDQKVHQERLKSREDAWKKQVQLLQNATSRESRRAVMERFGPGPHFVEITVDLPEDIGEKKFTIEMAPIEFVPHAVHLFLEQVAHGLWSSGWFYVNGPHVIQGGPVASDEDFDNAGSETVDERALALRPFKEKQLDTLSFPEYSEHFPHVQWTLGFTGRPGGPDFYINKVNNTDAHGPGGQHQHELEEFADPCFAKIIFGLDTIEQMIALPTIHEKGEYLHFFEEPVYITNMSIVEDPRNPKKKPSFWMKNTVVNITTGKTANATHTHHHHQKFMSRQREHVIEEFLPNAESNFYEVIASSSKDHGKHTQKDEDTVAGDDYHGDDAYEEEETKVVKAVDDEKTPERKRMARRKPKKVTKQ